MGVDGFVGVVCYVEGVEFGGHGCVGVAGGALEVLGTRGGVRRS